jgi:hypothetical protein
VKSKGSAQDLPILKEYEGTEATAPEIECEYNRIREMSRRDHCQSRRRRINLKARRPNKPRTAGNCEPRLEAVPQLQPPALFAPLAGGVTLPEPALARPSSSGATVPPTASVPRGAAAALLSPTPVQKTERSEVEQRHEEKPGARAPSCYEEQAAYDECYCGVRSMA